MERKKFVLMFFIILVILAISTTFIYREFLTKKSQEATKIEDELRSIGLMDTHREIIKSGKCGVLEKSERVWVVKNCENDVYFKIFFAEDGYFLGYCSSWNSPREAFLKVKNYLPVKECVNTTEEDRLLRENDSTKSYRVCGLRIVFIDECIVGVGR